LLNPKAEADMGYYGYRHCEVFIRDVEYKICTDLNLQDELHEKCMGKGNAERVKFYSPQLLTASIPHTRRHRHLVDRNHGFIIPNNSIINPREISNPEEK
jgi:hypothetical protein